MKMRKYVLLLLSFMMFSVFTAEAQEYTVKSIKDGTANEASSYEVRKDLLGNPCAILKVMASDKVSKAEGNVIGTPVQKPGATLVYITEGTKQIDLNFENHLQLSIKFPEHGIKAIKGGMLYVMTLEEGKKALTVKRDTTDAEGMALLVEDELAFKNIRNRDENKAYYWANKSANLGNAHGLCMLGICNLYGYGITKDVQKARELFLKSAEKGYVDAYRKLGDMHSSSMYGMKDFPKAIEYMTIAAEKGDSKAQSNLASWYKDGKKVTKDLEKAHYWYLKAAEQGDVYSQNALGDNFYWGEGTARDYKQAAF